MTPYIRQLASWLRLVFPPAGYVASLIAALVFYDLVLWWVFYRVGLPVPTDVLRQRDVVALVACVVLGVFRGTAFHPLFRTEYRKWLRTTPWRVGKRLPAGPVHLVVQDIVPLLIIWTLAPDLSLSPLRLPCWFLSGYLAALAIAFLFAGETWGAYVLAFGLGLALRLQWNVAALSAVLVALYAPALAALRLSLGRFPWDDSVWIDAKTPQWWRYRASGEVEKRDDAGLDLAWPFDRLGPRLPQFTMPYIHGVLLGLLCGWWVYAALSLIPQPKDRELIAFAAVWLTPTAAAVRLLVYVAHYRPPLSFFRGCCGWGSFRDMTLCTLRQLLQWPSHSLEFEN